MELKPIAFHHKVRQGYLDLIKDEPYRIEPLTILPEDSKEIVHNKVLHLILDVLKEKSGKWNFVGKKSQS